jgi:type IV secretory pathway ATPase VirB11/archaellum biosynthesis ATPase
VCAAAETRAASYARGTVLINGAPRSELTTLLNVIASEIAGDEPTALIDDRREPTLRRRPGLVKLPSNSTMTVASAVW